ncbi:MAG TPA: cytochrome c biogenesis protein CcsA [Pyrinomonadaceae bacterium]|nr:cytochrome c biogenesis protein CcsA [Pyrinomonadaceae bacterium]
MSEVLKTPAQVAAPPKLDANWRSLRLYLPFLIPTVAALALTLLRILAGGANFIDDGALMMLALAGYLIGAAFLLTNLYAPSGMAQKVGLWAAGLGYFFNLASWCVRWVAAHDRELEVLQRNGYGPEQMPWVWRYIPFANLYDLSLAFAAGAGLTTMLISGRRSFRFIGALSLPLAALILVLARFIGDEFINLPPVLDSYWRPIHVGTASISYGVALVCFAAAVLYLLKVGTKTEAMGVWAAIFAIGVMMTIGGQIGTFRVLLTGNYAASTVLEGSRMSIPLRVQIPYVGPALLLATVLLGGVILFFGQYLTSGKARMRAWGHRLLVASLVVQAVAVVLLVTQIKSGEQFGPCPASGSFFSKCYPTAQYQEFGAWLAGQQGVRPEQVKTLSPAQLRAGTEEFVQLSGSRLRLSLNANPVELAALITAFAATLFVSIFSFRTERLRMALPAAEKLDGLMYRTASVAFAGLAILLITGAIWANESWGRYWGWDSKETGAFVAWLTYGGFLHARIARGVTGKKSAYFAVVAFLLVIFTYLGVSYLLPGLHSYA